jgi:glycosyltransferase involved in cell wall biosynthesis
VDALCDFLKNETRPEVIALPFTLLISLARPLREATGSRVVCTLQGEELFLEGLAEPWRTRALDLIRRQVGEVDAFIAMSAASAGNMSNYLAIPREKISVVPLGINLKGYGPSDRSTVSPRVIGFLGRIAPEKGLHVLADAYRILRSRTGLPPLRLEAAGWMSPEHRAYLDGVRRKLKGEDFTYRGELDRDEKVRFLQGLDLFSMPCTYDEPKGLPVLEALACGVAVVQPRCGSFPEMLGATGGGLLVERDSPEALADGLEALLRDRERAHLLGLAGMGEVRQRFSISASARQTAEVYRGAR